jgi:hypothetical protein
MPAPADSRVPCAGVVSAAKADVVALAIGLRELRLKNDADAIATLSTESR